MKRMPTPIIIGEAYIKVEEIVCAERDKSVKRSQKSRVCKWRRKRNSIEGRKRNREEENKKERIKKEVVYK